MGRGTRRPVQARARCENEWYEDGRCSLEVSGPAVLLQADSQSQGRHHNEVIPGACWVVSAAHHLAELASFNLAAAQRMPLKRNVASHFTIGLCMLWEMIILFSIDKRLFATITIPATG